MVLFVCRRILCGLKQVTVNNTFHQLFQHSWLMGRTTNQALLLGECQGVLGECRGSVHRQDASAARCGQLLLLTASWQYFPVWCTDDCHKQEVWHLHLILVMVICSGWRLVMCSVGVDWIRLWATAVVRDDPRWGLGAVVEMVGWPLERCVDISPLDISPPDNRPQDIRPPDISPPKLICMICPCKACD